VIWFRDVKLSRLIRGLIDLSLNRDQFAIVLASLRARFREGEWVEGEPLTVGDLAARYGVSATPVREALSRLAGEGLLEDRRGRGYYAHRIDGVDLADLYRVQETLVQVALAAARRGGSQRGAEPIDADYLERPVQAWEALFEAVLRGANSAFLMDAHQRLADRLAPARRVESEMLGETSSDFEPLIAAQSATDWMRLECALAPFFRRRRAAADSLVVRMRLNSAKYKESI
jgi:DNA-binding GntR family transcriptional regulator